MNKTLYSLGFMNYCSHDPAACLMRKLPNGQIDYIHFEEGMLSRKKKSFQFPLRAIQACLNHYDIAIGDVDIIALDFMNDRSFHNTSSYYRKLVGDYIRAKLKLRHDQIYFCDSHHLAHAYTAFYPSGFDSAAILTIDGLGSEQDTHSIYLAEHNHGIKKIYSQKGTGIGLLYSLITEKLGFEDGEEGKTMGLAPYGADYPEMDDVLPNLKGDYQGYCVDYTRLMQRQPTPKLCIDIDKCQNKEDIYSPYYARLSYNIQKELECCLLHLAHEIRTRTGAKRLCIAGGVGLNCVANEIIQRSEIFDEVFVQPASGDTGVSLGLAMCGIESASKNNKATKINWKSNLDSFWTYAPVTIDNSDFKKLLSDQGVLYNSFDAKIVAEKLAKKEIVAYYEGGWEFGPRALGHRSFLADPRSTDMKAILNKKIKHREPYRPFAPIVLKEYFSEYFDSLVDNHQHMLYAVRCCEKAKTVIPTVVHVDNTARAQTVSANAGNIYKIINAFNDVTGVPVLVNTSLNDNDEPIVLTPIDALSCFLRTNADVLVVDDVMVNRNQFHDIPKLLKITEEKQLALLCKNTKQALQDLLDYSESIEDINGFLAKNLLSSIYVRYNESYDRLAQSFFVDKIKADTKCLVTDDYHYKILQKMAVYYKKPIPFMDIVILKDSFESLSKIEKGAYILMYNISLLIVDSEVRSSYPLLSTCSTFYRSRDRIVMSEVTDSNINEVSNKIMLSYEVNKKKSINDFFDNTVVVDFISTYL